MRPTTAMVLAAGLGLRMRPLTLDRPKALVELSGRTLIDRLLDRLAAAGVRRVVVNAHAFADRLCEHLARRNDLEIAISDERAALLDTGGALKKARPLLGQSPIFVANTDTAWIEGPGASILEALAGAWRGAEMESLLLLAPREGSLGFDGPGDFDLLEGGPGAAPLRHRGAAASARFAYAGVHILAPGVIDGWPEGAFGLLGRWLEMAKRRALFGAPMTGRWMHVGDPAALSAAQAALADR